MNTIASKIGTSDHNDSGDKYHSHQEQDKGKNTELK
jgi:hypothetical protein